MICVNGDYYEMPDAEYVARGILTQEECDYYFSLRIPGGSPVSLWMEKYRIDDKIYKAALSGLIEKHIPAKPQEAGVYVISDSLGVHGIMSHADGKHYDSKSSYRKELKANGFIEMGSDAPTKPRTELRGDFSNMKRDIARAYDQVMGT